MRGYLNSEIKHDDDGFAYVDVITADKQTDVYYLDHPGAGDIYGSKCECVWRHMGAFAWHYENPDCPEIHVDQEVRLLLNRLVSLSHQTMKIGH